ncbi:MAG: hypothetical protein A2V66_09285 [Ignavibacteria bacterium RBG_13_36_8]|nr:MAG: hypothetical protein A2V66_09285 [Ignavibacteria bacterium RBG_13_36_8]
MVEIKAVETKRELKTFINFPFTLYSGNKFWVPPLKFDDMNTLRSDKNPAFEFCEAKYWLAYRGGKVVGRIAGILNHRSIEKWKDKSVRFGWVDFIDDQEVVRTLFDTLENWAREKGMESVHGPLGFTDMDPEGMLVEGFNELGTLATIYNHSYYPMHLENLGYTKDVDWVEYEVKTPEDIPEKVERIAAAVLKRYNLRLLKVKKKKELLSYAHQIFHLINDAYKDLYGFVTLTEKQIDSYIKQYFGFIIPDYVPVIVDKDDKVVAFGITMPSLSKALQKIQGKLLPFGFIHILKAMKNNELVDFYLTAVRPDYQDKGVNSIMMYEMNKVYLKYKVKRVETNPELETNVKIQAQWRFYENRQHKRRRCFRKHL